jgi:hypothetical protein
LLVSQAQPELLLGLMRELDSLLVQVRAQMQASLLVQQLQAQQAQGLG